MQSKKMIDTTVPVLDFLKICEEREERFKTVATSFCHNIKLGLADAEEKAQKLHDSADHIASEILKEAHANASDIAQQVHAEKTAWEEEKLFFAQTQSSFQSKIKLDVGGLKYTTSLMTLRRIPDSMLGAMFSGRHTLSLDEDGCYFIDRDGTHFRYILNYLRSPETFRIHLVGGALEELQVECEYFGLLEFMFPPPTEKLPDVPCVLPFSEYIGDY